MDFNIKRAIESSKIKKKSNNKSLSFALVVEFKKQ